MDQNAKKKLATCRKLISQKKYGQALQELEVMVYKYSKLYQVHLFTALCYHKLQKYGEAEKAYLEVLDLKPDQTNAIKQLCDIYFQKGDLVKSTYYLQMCAALLKVSDGKKYRQTITKLVQLYQKDDNMEKIDPIFQDYAINQQTIGEDFLKIATSYFNVGVKNICFNLQKFEAMGVYKQKNRMINSSAKEGLNLLMIQIVSYLRSAQNKINFTKKDICNSIVEIKLYFPEVSAILMLLFFDEYCMGHLQYSGLILGQILKLMHAYFDREENTYFNLQYTGTQIFSVCMILSFQYLSFFKQFFSLDQLLLPYLTKLAAIYDKLQQSFIRQDYKKRIRTFILKECRQLNSISKYSNIENNLQQLKSRILALQNSFLQEVIAKIALNCITNYDKINDLKNLLKIRIKNLTGIQRVPHLYKYYYEYLLKIAKIYKALDEEIPIATILNYITTQDPTDLKYHLQKKWFQFSHAIRDNNEGKQQIAIQTLSFIQEIYQKLQASIKSIALRRIIILKSFLDDLQIEKEIKWSLQIQRSFENLQCAGVYYYRRGHIQEALVFLKEAFRLNQMHYHTNRLLLLCLLKLGLNKEAIFFLEQIKEGFQSVFWVNYLLSINKSNNRKFAQAQNLMSSALESFQAGSENNFRYFYERVRVVGTFAVQFMIQQNDYAIFYDQIVLSQEFIFAQCSILSNLYFQTDALRNKVNLFMKQAELLKILGRTKSALNYLIQAYHISCNFLLDGSSTFMLTLEVCLIKKEYATLLFYMRQFKESQFILSESGQICEILSSLNDCTAAQRQLVVKLDNQIKALLFQISVERLSIMMRFESYEFIDEYLINFKKKLTFPSKPSLNFYKNKYQFHILQYMHERKNPNTLFQGVSQFLTYFGLDLQERLSSKFENVLFGLPQEERKAIRQSMEDYYIVNYISKEKIQQNQLLHMLQIFPRSSVLLILFGMVTQDIKLKTAAFLKCIQLDKQSTISIDIFASLYLRQKNYMAAAKLFLKSLQINILNIKCYLGLAICLFCLICRSIDQNQPQQLFIIRKCLVRINSYLQYIRVQDPSENYNLLIFLKLLLTEQKRSNFQIKIILQSAQRALHKFRDTLLGQLLTTAIIEWSDFNIWKDDDQIKIVQHYLQNVKQINNKSNNEFALRIVEDLMIRLQQLKKGYDGICKQLLLKQIQIQMNQLSISICLALKQQQFHGQLYKLFIKSIYLLQTMIIKIFDQQQLNNLIYKIKGYLFQYLFKKDYNRRDIEQLQQCFPSIRNYQYFSLYHQKIPNIQREMSFQLMKDPANEDLRKIYNGWMVGIRSQHLRKGKLSYRLQLMNSNNQNSQNDSNCYKRLLFLYRDNNAFLLYLQNSWDDGSRRQQSNLKIWIKQIMYLSNKKQIKEDVNLKQKCYRLKLQMIAYSLYKYGNNKEDIRESQRNKINQLVLVYSIIDGREQQIKQLAPYYKGSIDQFDCWILMTLVSWMVKKYNPTAALQALLQDIKSQSKCIKIEGFILLLKILCILNRPIKTEEQLVDQIVDLTNITQQTGQKINANAQVIIQCEKWLLSGNWEQIENQLSRAVQDCHIVNYSDKILINFFEILKLYKTAESNPNGQGIIQGFLYMADCLLTMVKEPMFRGFILSLKGIIHSLATLQQTKDKNLKMSILLSPGSARSLFGVS